MSSTMRRTGHRSAVERAMVGDTKTSMVRTDHLGWLKCDGRLLLKSEYVSLYAVLGDSFGVSGEYFFLPDSQGRVVGLINVGDLSNNTLTGWVDGDVSGEETHTLILAEIPAHNHDISGGYLNVSGGVAGIDPSGNGYTSLDGVHSHTITDPGHTHSYVNQLNDAAQSTLNSSAASSADINQTTGSSTTGITINNSIAHRHQIASNGGSLPHNNIQPTIFMGNLFVFSGRPTFSAFDTVGSAGPNYFPPRVASRLY